MMAKKPKIWPCKVGTMPGLIVPKGNTKPTVGKRIEFRDMYAGSRYNTGIVTKVNSDGYFFVALS